ncbi:two-component response regulator, phosphate [Prochlorococcus marinus str. MIT 9313]|uniref:Two-component response regulator, phosphate n=1 Tax=Prochlorococcus marinus (strain MIT 9313) TaxID=74547 RepID=Q7V6Y3_PROMM|nr:response regulator transcription factor [Prochlorococcus marinus]CAE21169.1 two-component response regulator, phosphate [Prochlorococcus marinus str. MIT 9313]
MTVAPPKVIPPQSLKVFRLLVVEDDDAIRETIGEALCAEGFETILCGDGFEAVSILTSQPRHKFDLIILDVMLPGIGGLDICRRLREFDPKTRIFMISARDNEIDRVLGLEVGADDYLVKPFSVRELVARCRAQLRRYQERSDDSNAKMIEYGNLCLYIEECRVTKDGKDLSLAPKEYKILKLLLEHPRQVLSRDQILERIWGDDYFGDTKTVDVHIRWIREKIEQDPSSPQCIHTVRGFGYRFG